MMVSELHWRDLAQFAETLLQPCHFDREIYALLEQGYPETAAVDILGGMVGHYVIAAAGLAAAFGTPAPIALSELGELSAYLYALDVPNPKRASRLGKKAALYAQFLRQIEPAIERLAQVMPAVLGEYLSESYSTVQDPNPLLQYADRIAETDPENARLVVARAGAMALRGKRFWWGWAQQIHESLQDWVTAVTAFCDSVTHEGERPLGTTANERQRWQREAGYLQRIIHDVSSNQTTLAEIQSAQAETRDAELTEMIYALFDGEDALSGPLVAVYMRHRAKAIPHLIALAQDQRLWDDGGIGGGWPAIHAVTLLGQLEAAEAAESLVRIVASTDAEDYLHDCALQALESIGRPALRHLLDVMAYSRDDELKLALAPVLGIIGRSNPLATRALSALYRELPPHLDIGPVIIGLTALQDYQVLPLLQHAMDNPRLSWIDRMEIEAALAELSAPTLQTAPLA